MDRQKLDAILARKLPVFTASGLNCAETVLSTMCAYWDVESPLIPRIATPFGGGLAATRGVCGAVSGALMAIGLRLGREEGGDREAAYTAARRYMEWFEANYGTRDCADLIGLRRGEPGDSRHHGDAHVRVCRPLVIAACEHLANLFPQPLTL